MEYCAPGTQTHSAGIDNGLCPEIEKFFVQESLHVPNENNRANVIPTIRGACATHCNCSEKCHTCKQQ